jgi:hypothetical protein
VRGQHEEARFSVYGSLLAYSESEPAVTLMSASCPKADIPEHGPR